MEDVGVEFLQQRRHEAEKKAARGVDHRVAEIILCLEAAGARDIRVFGHGRIPRFPNQWNNYSILSGNLPNKGVK